MCSIMGMFGEVTDIEKFNEGFKETLSRGPDDTRVTQVEGGILGFHRLAIMGLSPEGMQPFKLNSKFLICNGEIYGFRKIKAQLEKEGYKFAGASDCEILLPLFEKYGTGMFKTLDAEFACIIYDEETKEVIAARDPIGIRPLYYGFMKEQNTRGQKEIYFASEPKNLVGLVDKIIPFPPGHYYKNGEFVCYRDMCKPYKEGQNSIFWQGEGLSETCTTIRELLIKGICKRLDSDAPLGFLLSGGLDSSLVCAVAARELGKPIETFSIGMETDAIDLKYAKQVAEFIGSNHHEVIITKADVINSLETVIKILGTFDITTIRASMGMYLLCKAIHEKSGIKVILTGEISDELFGYKYTDFAPTPEEFQKESEKRIRELHMYDVLRADRCISVNSLEARVPFGDLDFVNYVMSINPELKMNKYNKGKYLLRHGFEKSECGIEYLPENILMREKAAFSDAVGHSLVDDLKEYAENFYTDKEFESRILKYDHARPFTKESLLYREIFEKFYPGQAQMITDFWMPNKNWEGCNVNDPSARVLKNYGESGK